MADGGPSLTHHWFQRLVFGGWCWMLSAALAQHWFVSASETGCYYYLNNFVSVPRGIQVKFWWLDCLSRCGHFPPNTGHNVVSMLNHRLRRWPNIDATLYQRIMLTRSDRLSSVTLLYVNFQNMYIVIVCNSTVHVCVENYTCSYHVQTGEDVCTVFNYKGRSIV